VLKQESILNDSRSSQGNAKWTYFHVELTRRGEVLLGGLCKELEA